MAMAPVELLATTVGRGWYWTPARVTMLDWQGDETKEFSEAVLVRIEPPVGSDMRYSWTVPVGACERVGCLQ